ncbi:winged helix-turn-helix transcriptional regulator [Methanospirillum hungatei]|uniref:winged helix-turn-helix transcriptional regulator n=1 Tax=Methanospirillum hungatei TaxID=2203 RepID=UPI0026F02004|nr:winged helix-turn-helix transcriptional regulator [Methanospirillum hungatei]MCA1915932.1 winged helix-turn-helix transcriptional regulator [Methanospirillum hungatei]
MKFPALLLVAFLLSSHIWIAGGLQPTVSIQRTNCCMNSPCSEASGQTASGTGHCSCNSMPASMAQNACSCMHHRMMTSAPGVLERVRTFVVRGYRKITKKNVLDHPARKLLYDLIRDNPGLERKDLVKLSGLNEHTIKYHLDQIQSAGQISVCLVGNNRHYFENHGTYSSQEQQLFSWCHQDGPARIIGVVRENPGITRGDVAKELGVSGPVISRSILPLIQAGIIRQEADGKYRRYYPGWDAQTITHNLNS